MQPDALVRLDAHDQKVPGQPIDRRIPEHCKRRPFELDGNLGPSRFERLAGAQVKWNARPAPVVDHELKRNVGFGRTVGPDVRRSAIVLDFVVTHPGRNILPAYAVSQHRRVMRHVDRVERLCFFRADRMGLETRRRLHRHEREQLEQMVRHHVAQGAGVVVEAAPVTHRKGLRHRDLHVVDVVTIPNRLEQPICEPQHHDVLNRLFPEIVIDAIDLALVEHLKKFPVERLRRREIDSEWFLDDQPAPCPSFLASKTRLAKTAADRRECRRRRREIEEAVAAGVAGALDPRQRLLKSLVSRRIIGTAGDIADTTKQPAQDFIVDFADCIPAQPNFQLRAECLRSLLGPRDADDRKGFRQQTSHREIVERGREKTMGEVSGGTENDEAARIRRYCCRGRASHHHHR